jgi:hypothetical protein
MANSTLAKYKKPQIVYFVFYVSENYSGRKGVQDTYVADGN